MEELKTGNIKELWRVSYPMMVSFFSMMLMIFVDRIFLSWYSTDAFNASAQAGTLAWGFIVSWITLASMSEVFVAQYNGAKKFPLVGSAVWQMIWLTAISYLFYFPMAHFASALIYNPLTHSNEYYFFKLLMYFGPVFALIPAIGGFYIGRGQTQIMQWMAILGNVVNVILDPLLIFGFKDLIPSMGIKGAAIATGVGSLVEALLLLVLFMRKEHRTLFGTLRFRFDKALFFQTIRIGLPPAVFVGLELLGWAMFYHMMAMISPLHIFVATVCQTVLLLFLFFGMGLEKGAIALAGNFIGSGEKRKVNDVLLSGLKLVAIFALISTLFLIVYPSPLIDWFLKDPSLQLASMDLSTIKHSIQIGLIFTTIYITLENMRWMLNGVLTAAGDTFFLLISGAISIWLFLLLPTYFFIVLPKADVIYSFLIWIGYSSIAMAIVLFRFLQGNWKSKDLLHPSSPERGEPEKEI